MNSDNLETTIKALLAVLNMNQGVLAIVVLHVLPALYKKAKSEIASETALKINQDLLKIRLKSDE